ncbi:MAG: tRNA dihydrouridine(20/20a) synthase DusA [Calditrichaceae bacterium]|nr:tRNA dihydrouridine(20/20a) synthase DusA [Calditrichia bacterium]NUQ42679.1 tRNA dihydrouridine(20/20a) synthase DusA [Calditrichaceae bacterium]
MIPTPSHTQRGRLWPVSVAPMMDWTDRHYRYFMRRITRHTLLYTEMKTTGAVLFGERERILGFSPAEKPLALQLGGDDPAELAECAGIAEEMGYDEVNLNVGCPSGRVQRGNFGACLMAEPGLVASCLKAMRGAVSIPVTVKHRIGIDGLEDYEDLKRFVGVVAASGCDRFIVHARIALLQGLNPKENRTVPPLRYEEVYRLKEDFPGLAIEINGGIKSLEETFAHLNRADGVMIGRAAYENPYLFATVDSLFYEDQRQPPTRREIVEAMIPYLEEQIRAGVFPRHVTRHMLGLFHGRPGAGFWKRCLSENAHKPETTAAILLDAAGGIPAEVLDERPELPVFACSSA